MLSATGPPGFAKDARARVGWLAYLKDPDGEHLRHHAGGYWCFTTADLERIEELHQADMRASKPGDYRTLRRLYVRRRSGAAARGRMIRGRESLDQSFATAAQATGPGKVPPAGVMRYGTFTWVQVKKLEAFGLIVSLR